MVSTTTRSSSLKSDELSSLMPPNRDSTVLKICALSRVSNPSVSRLRLTASTTRNPLRHSSSMRGMSAGGCCRSASMVITASPVAALRPARSAASLPKLREKRTALMRGSRAAISRSRIKVSSRLPSSTTTISQRAAQVSRMPAITSVACAIPADSLCAGMTTLIKLPWSGPWPGADAGSDKRSVCIAGLRASRESSITQLQMAIADQAHASPVQQSPCRGIRQRGQFALPVVVGEQPGVAHLLRVWRPRVTHQLIHLASLHGQDLSLIHISATDAYCTLVFNMSAPMVRRCAIRLKQQANSPVMAPWRGPRRRRHRRRQRSAGWATVGGPPRIPSPWASTDLP